MKIPIHQIFNLEDRRERDELIEIALDIPKSLQLTIHEQMFKEGHRDHPSRIEIAMYHYLGKEIYDTLCRLNFEYSCLEADYVGVKKDSRQFHIICKANRELMWQETKDILPEIINGAYVDSIREMSKQEMLDVIRRKYAHVRV